MSEAKWIMFFVGLGCLCVWALVGIMESHERLMRQNEWNEWKKSEEIEDEGRADI